MPASVIACGVILALADNILSFAYHGYQPELFPTRLRARRWVSSISSCSQLSTMSNALMIAAILRGVTPPAAFVQRWLHGRVGGSDRDIRGFHQEPAAGENPSVI